MPTKHRPARASKKGPHSRAMAMPQPLHAALPAVNYHVEDAAHLRALMAANPGLLDMMNQLHREDHPPAPTPDALPYQLSPDTKEQSRKMTIPTTFTLGGLDWLVKVAPELWDGNTDLIGVCRYATCDILLQPYDRHNRYLRQKIEQTYCHELAHALLHNIKHPDRSNEAVVELLGITLHQYFATAEGDLKI